MRFPSLDVLARHALAVLRRFPWTLAVAAVAAAAAVMGTFPGTDPVWERLAFIAALGFPLTLALALLGEERVWPPAMRHLTILGGLLGLTLFFFAWPGVERRHEAIRYLQVSAALHLCVAFLPFLGRRETLAFWQYNRRLFLGFLRAWLFSNVLFVGIAIALGALDKLFGVDVESSVYFRIWLVIALLGNTWIFLAAVPEGLAGLEGDPEYPRGLKVFSQYILTPLVFTYLVILLAYLVKILIGGEWPSGWIGWLVGSVAVTGLLGFLLVHPLRSDPGEAWIRTYARWLFIGLIPAALMLLVAFWKRILPYGLTEPRVLGLLLGLWLLGIAVLFTIRSGTGIRIIPSSLAVLLLLTVYGPVSATAVSIGSQGRRMARMLRPPGSGAPNAREASAALRFLLDHRAGDAIAGAIGQELPAFEWPRPRYGESRDSVARRLMDLAGVAYVPEYAHQVNGWFHLASNHPIPVGGYAWVLPVSSTDPEVRVLAGDTIAVVLQPGGVGRARIRVGADTLTFDLGALARRYADSIPIRGTVMSGPLVLEGESGRRRSALVVNQLSGNRDADSLTVGYWIGSVLLGE